MSGKPAKTEALRLWRARNREAVRRHNQTQAAKMPPTEKRWRARMSKPKVKNAWDGVFSVADWVETVEYFDFSCAYCLAKPRQLGMDHFYPLGLGGAHSAVNCVPACATCNDDKHGMPPLVWLLDRISDVGPNF